MNVISAGELRYKGKNVPAGKTVENVSPALAKRWFSMKIARPKKKRFETATKPTAETAEIQRSKPEKLKNLKKEAEPEESAVQFPVHTGGGWYQLSNGEKVRGEDDALKAQKELEKKEE